MPFDALEWHTRVKTKAKLRKDYNPLVVSAAESLEAAVWLLSGYLIPQALSMFHNTIELLFKAELARIHLAMIADPRQLKYDDLKALFRDQVKSHPRGSGLNIPDFDIERSIAFAEAMKRVKEFYPTMVSSWEAKLLNLNEMRNDIVHYGGDDSARTRQLSAVLLTAVPFISEFFKEAYTTEIGKVVFKSVERELAVARDTARELEREGKPLENWILNTVSVLLRYRWGLGTDPVDDEGFIKDEGGRDFEIASQVKQDFEGQGNDVDCEITCHLCGAHPVFVSFELHDKKKKDVRALAMICFRCGLDIRPDQAPMAHFHFGPVKPTDADKFLKNIGER